MFERILKNMLIFPVLESTHCDDNKSILKILNINLLYIGILIFINFLLDYS